MKMDKLWQGICLNFFVRKYQFSFFTMLSPKIYTVFCFSAVFQCFYFSYHIHIFYFSGPFSFLTWCYSLGTPVFCFCFCWYYQNLTFQWYFCFAGFRFYLNFCLICISFWVNWRFFIIIIDVIGMGTGYFTTASTCCNITTGWYYFRVSKLFNYLGFCIVFFSKVIYFFLQRWNGFPVCWFVSVCYIF